MTMQTPNKEEVKADFGPIHHGPAYSLGALSSVNDNVDGTNNVVQQDCTRPEEFYYYHEEDEYDEDEDDIEDDEDNEDEDIDYKYRQYQVWQPKKRGEKFGQLREITGEEYVKEVTHAGRGVRVVLFLYRPCIPLCFLMNHHFYNLAPKFPRTKFLRMLDSSCIPNYPEKYLPTVFIYENGCLRNRMMGEKECGGKYVLEEELKWLLRFVGAIN
ncbi:viral IAP-associated factor homolog isoform X1 [Engraulis encrasicolus]|uniref:viral IAP-associated factor homolog isoform X1 n=1 Tax=Engraulis encrasicolus TaxID=184585 RepID=UPI002FD68B8B